MHSFIFTIRISAIGAWVLLCFSTAFMIISSRVWRLTLVDIYGDASRPWPISTEIYLHSAYWGATIPIVVGVLMLIAWMRDHLERSAPFFLLATHTMSVLTLAFTFYAAIRPFLTTMWRMGTP